jgi:hypothetical protein
MLVFLLEVIFPAVAYSGVYLIAKYRRGCSSGKSLLLGALAGFGSVMLEFVFLLALIFFGIREFPMVEIVMAAIGSVPVLILSLVTAIVVAIEAARGRQLSARSSEHSD